MAMHISSYALALKHAAADLLQVCLLKGFLFGRSLLIANKISARPFTLPKKNPFKSLKRADLDFNWKWDILADILPFCRAIVTFQLRMNYIGWYIVVLPCYRNISIENELYCWYIVVLPCYRNISIENELYWLIYCRSAVLS
jgi:hypothetical protein